MTNDVVQLLQSHRSIRKFTEEPVTDEMVEDIIEQQGVDKMAQLYPTGRVTTPEEVASVICFLASGLAPQTTGNTIDLNGAADVR